MEKLKNFAKDSRIIGIEPSIIACEKSNLKGQKVINKYFNFENSQDILKEIKGYPNLIIARNVITHIQNIRDFIKGLRNIMDKESILFLQSHYWPSLIEKANFDAIYHENYQYFTFYTLIKLLEKFG